LHLEGPAIRFFPEFKSLKRLAANRTERSHIGRPNAVQNPENQSHHVSGKDLVKVHAARLALSAGARSDHKVVRSLYYRPDKAFHMLRTIATIAIKKYDDFAIGRDSP
jgi:hypothetical protein